MCLFTLPWSRGFLIDPMLLAPTRAGIGEGKPMPMDRLCAGIGEGEGEGWGAKLPANCPQFMIFPTSESLSVHLTSLKSTSSS